MTVPKSVRAWVADAEATYGPTFDTWFPSEFDWPALCADVPAMAARLGETWAASTASAAKARLEETAQAAFRGAAVATLALLAAYDVAAEPDDALSRLCGPLSGDEQDALGPSLAEDLAIVERLLAGPSSDAAEPSVRGLVAARAARAVQAVVRALLTEGLAKEAETVVRLGAASGPMAKVLAGVVSVAIAMAGLRYAVAVEVDERAGVAPLHLDVFALESALGPPKDA